METQETQIYFKQADMETHEIETKVFVRKLQKKCCNAE